jgi:pimeloyl-ACP methyl ester carboxylesterase
MSQRRDRFQRMGLFSAQVEETRSRRFLGRAVAIALGAFVTAVPNGGCSAVLSTGAPLPHDVRERAAEVAVHGEPLTLHLASAQASASASTPLVLYATGDGGWFGAAVGMFHTIASNGYPTVGFSSKEFMRIEHKRSRPLNVAQLAEGYQQIIDAACAQLRLPPQTPLVLTGWSRGAALAVLVAGRFEADSRVVGLVAIGLAAEEHLDIEGDTDDDGDAAQGAFVSGVAPARPIALYPLLSKLAPRRVVVVQAAGDGYLPAARARELFGADTTTSRLVAIAARNHRFSGAESDFATALIEAMQWIASDSNRTH